jgi:transposase
MIKNDDWSKQYVAEYECKIAELERKVGPLTMEVDLLKKGQQLGGRLSEGGSSSRLVREHGVVGFAPARAQVC